MDLPGSFHGHTAVPFLYLDNGKPGLRDDWNDDANPDYGSVSRGKYL